MLRSTRPGPQVQCQVGRQRVRKKMDNGRRSETLAWLLENYPVQPSYSRGQAGLLNDRELAARPFGRKLPLCRIGAADDEDRRRRSRVPDHRAGVPEPLHISPMHHRRYPWKPMLGRDRAKYPADRIPATTPTRSAVSPYPEG